MIRWVILIVESRTGIGWDSWEAEVDCRFRKFHIWASAETAWWTAAGPGSGCCGKPYEWWWPEERLEEKHGQRLCLIFPSRSTGEGGRILFLKNTPMQRSKYLDTVRVLRIAGGGSYLLLLWGPAEWLWPADDPLFLPACSLGGQTLRPARTAPQTHPRHIYLKATHHIYHIFVTTLCIKNVLTLYLWMSGPWKMQ